MPHYQSLTVSQGAVLDLPVDGFHLITGPPGSGKSVMAVYRTESLANMGQPVILLQPGGELDWDPRQWGVDQTIVSIWHSWFPRWFRGAYGEDPPRVSEWGFDWDACSRIAGHNPAPEELIPHLIVDEGQALPRGFYTFFLFVRGSMTVFCDDNQPPDPPPEGEPAETDPKPPTAPDSSGTNAENMVTLGIKSHLRLETTFQLRAD